MKGSLRKGEVLKIKISENREYALSSITSWEKKLKTWLLDIELNLIMYSSK